MTEVLKSILFVLTVVYEQCYDESLGLVSIKQQMPRPRHKNKAIIRLSSHPSRQSLCFDSKLVVVVVVIGLMETRLNYQEYDFSMEFLLLRCNKPFHFSSKDTHNFSSD